MKIVLWSVHANIRRSWEKATQGISATPRSKVYGYLKIKSKKGEKKRRKEGGQGEKRKEGRGREGRKEGERKKENPEK